MHAWHFKVLCAGIVARAISVCMLDLLQRLCNEKYGFMYYTSDTEVAGGR